MADARDEIWAMVVRSNDAWTGGRPEEVEALFDEGVVMVGPDGSVAANGRAALVKSIVDFVGMSSTHRFEVLAHRVDVFGDTAVVDYRFEVDYTIAQQRSTEQGREVLVLRQRDGAWKTVWRTQTAS